MKAGQFIFFFFYFPSIKPNFFEVLTFFQNFALQRYFDPDILKIDGAAKENGIGGPMPSQETDPWPF
jgi:hypothetical protein